MRDKSKILTIILLAVLLFQMFQPTMLVLAETVGDEELNQEITDEGEEDKTDSKEESTKESKKDTKVEADKPNKESKEEPKKDTNKDTKVDKSKDEETTKEKKEDKKTPKKSSIPDVPNDLTNYNHLENIEEVTKDELDFETLAVNDKGEMLYKGEPLYVGKGDDVIPAKLDEMMQVGVTQKVITHKQALLNNFKNVLPNFLMPTTTFASESTPYIENRGVHHWGAPGYPDSYTAEFRINGQIAFCFQHEKARPGTGTPYGPEKPYDDPRIQRALYYGWGGPENIFKNKSQGIVVTHLVLSRIYNGSFARDYLDGYDELWDLAHNGKMPNYKVELSDTNLSISVKNGKQVSQTTTLKSDKNNSITLKVPANVTLVNETAGTKKTGGSLKVKGGQKFHLEAPLSYGTTFKADRVVGEMKTFQPLIVEPKASSYQVLGGARLYIDPANNVSFTVPFKKQEVTMTINHRDTSSKNKVFKKQTKKVLIGNNYNECRMTNATLNKNYKEPYVRDSSSNCKTGKVPSNNFTVNLDYTTQWDLTVKYINSESGKSFSTFKAGTYKYKERYSHHSPQWSEGNPVRAYDKEKTDYRNTNHTKATRTQGGNMPRADKTIEFIFDPYSLIHVRWQNIFPKHDIFKETGKTNGNTGLASDPENGKKGYTMDRHKVGTNFKYTQPESFTKNGLIYDRVNSSTFSGEMRYAILTHVFDYVLRREVEVNYYDKRTGEKIKDSKEYIVHQGDDYSETPETITTGDYVYRYIESTGDLESGVVGTDNLVINYWYDIPLAKVELEKLQVYTAPSDEGLPVKVYINKEDNYESTVNDMSDSDMTISLALYQDNMKLDSNKYTANEIPDDLMFKVSPDVLEVNEKKEYTVRFEGYIDHEYDIPNGYGELTTDGYTSSEESIEFDVNSNASNEQETELVVMTEVTPITVMKEYYERFIYRATPLEDQKSGYGVETDLQMNYENDLGANYQFATAVDDVEFDFYAPESFQDSHLDYEVKDGKIEVGLDGSVDGTPSPEVLKMENKFTFPHMNVEMQTGHLFSDKQVADGDERIENDLRGGGDKFYSPVWVEIDTYDVNYQSNNLGVHKVDFNLTDNWNIYAQMRITMDSGTKDLDEIVFMPINAENPFAGGLPDNWTEADAEWLKY